MTPRHMLLTEITSGIVTAITETAIVSNIKILFGIMLNSRVLKIAWANYWFSQDLSFTIDILQTTKTYKIIT